MWTNARMVTVNADAFNFFRCGFLLSAALRCYLLAWSRAQALAVILDEPEELTVGT